MCMCMYLRYFFEGNFKSWLVVNVESQQRPPEPCLPPVPSLHTQVNLTQILMKFIL